MTHFSVQQVELLWLPKENELGDLQMFFNDSKGKKQDFLNSAPTRGLRKYISDLLCIDVDFKDVRLKADLNLEIADSERIQYKFQSEEAEEVSNYTEYLISISCDLRLEKSFDNCFRSRKRGQSLINKYCMSSNIKKGMPETWLQLDLNSACEEQKIRSHEPDLKISSFALGNFSGLNTFVEHFCSSSQFPDNYGFKITEVNGKFINDREKFELYFMVVRKKGKNDTLDTKETAFTHRLFKLELPYSQLHRLLICDSEKFTLYFQYLIFPLLYGVSQSEESDQFVSFYDITSNTYWQRTLTLCNECPSDVQLQFSMNTALKIEFKQKDYYSLNQLLQFCKSTETFFSPVTVMPTRSNIQISGIDNSTFECFYALRCILTRSYEFVDQLFTRNELREINKFFQEESKKNSKALMETLYEIYNAIEKGSIVAFYPTIKAVYNRIVQTSIQGKGNEYTDEKYVYIKKAYLFPTHVRFCPPQLALKNRVTKSGTPECFLRISVRDIDFQNLNHTVRSFGFGQRDFQKNFFNLYIKRPLLRGIKLGNCHYHYIGASGSQLKSHSLWYFSKDPNLRGVTAMTIRRDIGDLDKILDVPKFMARLGMSFSQAMGRINVPQEFTNVTKPELDVTGVQKIYMSEDDSFRRRKKKKYMQGEIAENSCSEESEHGSETEETVPHEEEDDDDDDEVEEDPYVFSDGIGRMSQEIADEIYEKLGLENEKPSAVQIRYAGCKGMLTVDPTLEGKNIMFRESMKKYNSKDESLEILKYSKPRNVFLNRSLIAILEEKGIPKEIFVKLQKEMFQSLVKSMFYDDETSTLLKDYAQLRIDYEAISKSGFSFTEDPFFRSMMLAIFKKQLQLLKDNARIKLHNDYGRNMFGVLDETRSLEYGEIFVQYTKWDSEETEILEGTVVVTKNPSMHPGDVRKFEAVNVPALKHIRDCIVFPARGHRPHPDEMAGSDLDGDEYVVIWLEELIFEDENSPAMDFAVRKAKKSKRECPIEPKDELDHFCEFIVNDNSGKIANAYLAWADAEGMIGEDGTVNEKCLSLAKLYAKSLDFVKSGTPAIMGYWLTKSSYPDFFGKKEGKGVYMSKKALGVLYRNCKSLELGFEATLTQIEYRCDDDLLYGSWKEYEVDALKTLHQYSQTINSHLKKYGLTSEGEFFSGCLPFNSVLYPSTSAKYHALEMMEFEVQWLLDKYQKEFFAQFGGEPTTNEFTENMLSKASAWYAVSYKKSSNSELVLQLFSLPWVVFKLLMIIKQTKLRRITASNILVKNSSYVERIIDASVTKSLPPIDSVTDIESAEVYKFAILDISHEVLTKWAGTLNFFVNNKVRAGKTIEDIFHVVSEKLLTCSGEYIRRQLQTEERKKVTSPGYYVLETLFQIAEFGINFDPNVSFSDTRQELGLLAWITLVKLAYSVNTKHLGLTNEDMQNYNIPPMSFLAQQADIVEVIHINCFGKLLQIYINAEESLKKFLMKESKVSDICFRIEYTNKRKSNKSKPNLQGKNTFHNNRSENHNSQHNNNKSFQPSSAENNPTTEDSKSDKVSSCEFLYSLRIIVKGSRFCIERLKELIFASSVAFINRASNDPDIKHDLKASEIALQELRAWGNEPLVKDKKKDEADPGPEL